METVLQRAHEQYPRVTPRIISDNGPQFIAKDFKEFIRGAGMTHVRTSPYYPQSNGKLERWHQTLKVTTIRPKAPSSLDEARRIVAAFVAYYNHERLHSAIGFVTPADSLAGRAEIRPEAQGDAEGAHPRGQRAARHPAQWPGSHLAGHAALGRNRRRVAAAVLGGGRLGDRARDRFHHPRGARPGPAGTVDGPLSGFHVHTVAVAQSIFRPFVSRTRKTMRPSLRKGLFAR